TGGVCGFSFTSAGFVTASQTPGDCKQNQCDGSGNIVNVNDNTDVPASIDQCLGNACNAGNPQHPAQPSGTACSENGRTKCNGNGSCVQCLAPSDCGSNTACQQHTCNAGTCGVNDSAMGTVVSNPVQGDCHSDQCDGNGGVTSNAVDNTDVPIDDGKQCT